MSLLAEPQNENMLNGEINPEVLEGIGCTANVILMDKKDNKMVIANAGDSRSILCRKR